MTFKTMVARLRKGLYIIAAIGLPAVAAAQSVPDVMESLGSEPAWGSNALCPLAALPWKRPNIGSRMNREVHVRIWERPEVRVLRATSRKRTSRPISLTREALSLFKDHGATRMVEDFVRAG
jgi:hypothetical protein